MKEKRREFLKVSGLAALGLGFGITNGFANQHQAADTHQPPGAADDSSLSIIGPYGAWAASLIEKEIPSLSFRNPSFRNLEAWKKTARNKVLERLHVPDLGGMPLVKVNRQYDFDGLHVEELSWQLPYGRPTEAVLLRPLNKTGKLPAILGLHCHGGNKYFGTKKIVRTSEEQHPLMKEHQAFYYSGLAWANEIAKRGYVVLVHDAFTFGSRRVMMQDVPERIRKGLNDNNPEEAVNIKAYNQWAGDHEHIMAKSLFSAGTTWPGVFYAEDKKALDILAARKDVDANRMGCCGLSGGGLRTDILAGLDDRVRCAVSVGFMTTWKDFVLNKSFTHTWMSYIPLLPNELDFPELLGLRAPLPALVLNDIEDGLFTLSEMKASEEILQDVYKKAGAENNFKCSFHPGPHKFDSKMQVEAFDWFDKWLK
jgi:dienelactone hydrolase